MIPGGQQEDILVSKRFNAFLKDYQERITNFKPNTAISACMEWLNDASSNDHRLSKSTMEKLLVALSVLIPHFSSELLQVLLGKELSQCTWPAYDARLAAPDQIELIVQVNGKLRGQMMILPGSTKESLEAPAHQLVEKWFEGKTIKRVIFVPDRLINFVV